MTDAPGPAPRPLADIRVVDLSRALAGPYATMMMADAGADVVKVEPPGGDDSRGWLPYVDRNGHRESAYYMSANRNKRSVVLDLKSPEGADRLRWLVAQADVLVENYRPGVLDRLGLGLDRLRELNPRLVTLSITGFGKGGPDGARPGFDQIVQAEAGLMALTGQPGGTPQRVGLPMCDILAGLFGAFGVMTALRAREHTGRGQAVETSLLAAVVGVHVFHGVGWLSAGVEPVLTGNRHPSIAPYGVFGCEDADIVIAVGSESLWRKFAPIVGLDADRPDIATNIDRVGRADALQKEIDALLADRTAEEVLAALDAAGVPAGRIRTVPEVYDWAQVRESMVLTLPHPTLGDLEMPASPLQLSEHGDPRREAPPSLGGDQDAVFAGYAPSGGRR
ncbi:CaiB/BaiF CoA transferase family protein [Mycolicibacterium arseniciresistens]|uniref:CoA transferase n=1 Tax=Mycolicibacterium arseniciresistens TaxID=3062257 RepID=A0ABT8UG42_9MYCO|nr:CoA transferase [Mycolicibacterium arseniciresistens]MDO3636757.1 CoA transferase [Mycolicibacterium arseniciresistens]